MFNSKSNTRQTIEPMIISLSAWQKPEQRNWVRIIALAVILTFISPYFTWAFDSANYSISQPSIIFNNKTVFIPEKLGTVSHLLQGDNRLVVHIQDLHCNYEVQMNIAQIIHLLAEKHGLRLVSMEGTSLPIDTTKIRTFPIKKIRTEVSDYFVRQGKLSGAEFYAATGEYPVRLEGIENEDLYKRNKRSVEFILKDEGQGYCYDLRDSLDALKPGLYNSRLLKFDKQCLLYRDGKNNVLTQTLFLVKTARRLGYDLAAYPTALRYARNRRALFTPKIDADALFKELEILEYTLREYFYINTQERELDRRLLRLSIIEKLINISGSPEELEVFRQNRGDFQVQVFVDFIRSYDKTGELEMDPEIFMLDGLLNAVADFYRVADERSRAFVQNTLRNMQKQQEKLMVLVTGGFHTEHVLAGLQAQGISILSLKPKLTQQDLVNPYFTLLRNRKTPLEKLLSQEQRVFTLEPYLPTLSDPHRVSAPGKSSERRALFNRLLELFIVIKARADNFMRTKVAQEVWQQVEKILDDYQVKSVEDVNIHSNQVFSFPVTANQEDMLAVVCTGKQRLRLKEEDILRKAVFPNEYIMLIKPENRKQVQVMLDSMPTRSLADLNLHETVGLYLAWRLLPVLVGQLRKLTPLLAQARSLVYEFYESRAKSMSRNEIFIYSAAAVVIIGIIGMFATPFWQNPEKFPFGLSMLGMMGVGLKDMSAYAPTKTTVPEYKTDSPQLEACVTTARKIIVEHKDWIQEENEPRLYQALMNKDFSSIIIEKAIAKVCPREPLALPDEISRLIDRLSNCGWLNRSAIEFELSQVPEINRTVDYYLGIIIKNIGHKNHNFKPIFSDAQAQIVHAHGFFRFADKMDIFEAITSNDVEKGFITGHLLQLYFSTSHNAARLRVFIDKLFYHDDPEQRITGIAASRIFNSGRSYAELKQIVKPLMKTWYYQSLVKNIVTSALPIEFITQNFLGDEAEKIKQKHTNWADCDNHIKKLIREYRDNAAEISKREALAQEILDELAKKKIISDYKANKAMDQVRALNAESDGQVIQVLVKTIQNPKFTAGALMPGAKLRFDSNQMTLNRFLLNMPLLIDMIKINKSRRFISCPVFEAALAGTKEIGEKQKIIHKYLQEQDRSTRTLLYIIRSRRSQQRIDHILEQLKKHSIRQKYYQPALANGISDQFLDTIFKAITKLPIEKEKNRAFAAMVKRQASLADIAEIIQINRSEHSPLSPRDIQVLLSEALSKENRDGVSKAVREVFLPNANTDAQYSGELTTLKSLNEYDRYVIIGVLAGRERAAMFSPRLGQALHAVHHLEADGIQTNSALMFRLLLERRFAAKDVEQALRIAKGAPAISTSDELGRQTEKVLNLLDRHSWIDGQGVRQQLDGMSISGKNHAAVFSAILDHMQLLIITDKEKRNFTAEMKSHLMAKGWTKFLLKLDVIDYIAQTPDDRGGFYTRITIENLLLSRKSPVELIKLLKALRDLVFLRKSAIERIVASTHSTGDILELLPQLAAKGYKGNIFLTVFKYQLNLAEIKEHFLAKKAKKFEIKAECVTFVKSVLALRKQNMAEKFVEIVKAFGRQELLDQQETFAQLRNKLELSNIGIVPALKEKIKTDPAVEPLLVESIMRAIKAKSLFNINDSPIALMSRDLSIHELYAKRFLLKKLYVVQKRKRIKLSGWLLHTAIRSARADEDIQTIINFASGYAMETIKSIISSPLSVAEIKDMVPCLKKHGAEYAIIEYVLRNPQRFDEVMAMNPALLQKDKHMQYIYRKKLSKQSTLKDILYIAATYPENEKLVASATGWVRSSMPISTIKTLRSRLETLLPGYTPFETEDIKEPDEDTEEPDETSLVKEEPKEPDTAAVFQWQNKFKSAGTGIQWDMVDVLLQAEIPAKTIGEVREAIIAEKIIPGYRAQCLYDYFELRRADPATDMKTMCAWLRQKGHDSFIIDWVLASYARPDPEPTIAKTSKTKDQPEEVVAVQESSAEKTVAAGPAEKAVVKPEAEENSVLDVPSLVRMLQKENLINEKTAKDFAKNGSANGLQRVVLREVLETFSKQNKIFLLSSDIAKHAKKLTLQELIDTYLALKAKYGTDNNSALISIAMKRLTKSQRKKRKPFKLRRNKEDYAATNEDGLEALKSGILPDFSAGDIDPVEKNNGTFQTINTKVDSISDLEMGVIPEGGNLIVNLGAILLRVSRIGLAVALFSAILPWDISLAMPAIAGLLSGLIAHLLRLLCWAYHNTVPPPALMSPSLLRQKQAQTASLFSEVIQQMKRRGLDIPNTDLGLLTKKNIEWDALADSPKRWQEIFQQPKAWQGLFLDHRIGRGESARVLISPTVLFFPAWLQKRILTHELIESLGRGHALATLMEHAPVVWTLIQWGRDYLRVGLAKCVVVLKSLTSGGLAKKLSLRTAKLKQDEFGVVLGMYHFMIRLTEEIMPRILGRSLSQKEIFDYNAKYTAPLVESLWVTYIVGPRLVVAFNALPIDPRITMLAAVLLTNLVYALGHGFGVFKVQCNPETEEIKIVPMRLETWPARIKNWGRLYFLGLVFYGWFYFGIVLAAFAVTPMAAAVTTIIIISRPASMYFHFKYHKAVLQSPEDFPVWLRVLGMMGAGPAAMNASVPAKTKTTVLEYATDSPQLKACVTTAKEIIEEHPEWVQEENEPLLYQVLMNKDFSPIIIEKAIAQVCPRHPLILPDEIIDLIDKLSNYGWLNRSAIEFKLSQVPEINRTVDYYLGIIIKNIGHSSHNFKPIFSETQAQMVHAHGFFRFADKMDIFEVILPADVEKGFITGSLLQSYFRTSHDATRLRPVIDKLLDHEEPEQRITGMAAAWIFNSGRSYEELREIVRPLMQTWQDESTVMKIVRSAVPVTGVTRTFLGENANDIKEQCPNWRNRYDHIPQLIREYRDKEAEIRKREAQAQVILNELANNKIISKDEANEVINEVRVLEAETDAQVIEKLVNTIQRSEFAVGALGPGTDIRNRLPLKTLLRNIPLLIDMLRINKYDMNITRIMFEMALRGIKDVEEKRKIIYKYLLEQEQSGKTVVAIIRSRRSQERIDHILEQLENHGIYQEYYQKALANLTSDQFLDTVFKAIAKLPAKEEKNRIFKVMTERQASLADIAEIIRINHSLHSPLSSRDIQVLLSEALSKENRDAVSKAVREVFLLKAGTADQYSGELAALKNLDEYDRYVVMGVLAGRERAAMFSPKLGKTLHAVHQLEADGVRRNLSIMIKELSESGFAAKDIEQALRIAKGVPAISASDELGRQTESVLNLLDKHGWIEGQGVRQQLDGMSMSGKNHVTVFSAILDHMQLPIIADKKKRQFATDMKNSLLAAGWTKFLLKLDIIDYIAQTSDAKDDFYTRTMIKNLLVSNKPSAELIALLKELRNLGLLHKTDIEIIVASVHPIEDMLDLLPQLAPKGYKRNIFPVVFKYRLNIAEIKKHFLAKKANQIKTIKACKSYIKSVIALRKQNMAEEFVEIIEAFGRQGLLNEQESFAQVRNKLKLSDIGTVPALKEKIKTDPAVEPLLVETIMKAIHAQPLFDITDGHIDTMRRELSIHKIHAKLELLEKLYMVQKRKKIEISGQLLHTILRNARPDKDILDIVDFFCERTMSTIVAMIASPLSVAEIKDLVQRLEKFGAEYEIIEYVLRNPPQFDEVMAMDSDLLQKDKGLQRIYRRKLSEKTTLENILYIAVKYSENKTLVESALGWVRSSMPIATIKTLRSRLETLLPSYTSFLTKDTKLSDA
ncbi:hypothetical protein KAR34_13555, partial [bacterium]|nr:hypothetical protein [bacterium]